MSRTLNLTASLLDRSRKLSQLGRKQDAHRLLQRLLTFRHLGSDIAQEAHALLADIQLTRQNIRLAGRHIRSALAHQPNNPQYHIFMARCAAQRKCRSRVETALRHYRQAIFLDSRQPAWLAEFGVLAVRHGRLQEGLASLRQAAGIAPDDAEVLKSLIQSLLETGQEQEALQRLKAALFRNSRNPAFRKIWQHFQYQRLLRWQMARRTSELSNKDGDPVILRFLTNAASLRSGRLARQRERRAACAPPHSETCHPSRLNRQRRAQ
jgi:tetratricopeptide (TPR) repeat protein